jgi:hypothetical protein
MTRTEYFATLTAWKQAYAELTLEARKNKAELKVAARAFAKELCPAPEKFCQDSTYYLAHKDLSAREDFRLAFKAKARQLLDDRAVLKDAARAYWESKHTA